MPVPPPPSPAEQGASTPFQPIPPPLPPLGKKKRRKKRRPSERVSAPGQRRVGRDPSAPGAAKSLSAHGLAPLSSVPAPGGRRPPGPASQNLVPAGASGPPPPGTLAESTDALIGQVIGRCRLQSLLGRGGMGYVYRALHLTLQIDVVVKILASDLARNQKLIARFVREARSTAQLDHPNIVRIFDLGQEAGYFYIVMQYIRGENVQEILDREKQIPWQEACRIMYEASKGLAYAHDRGIIHRDIKPDNIMLTEGEGQVKVADFGLAKNVSGEVPITRSGSLLGTPHYMSPEQCQGVPSDGRTDIYSLGITFFQMLHGYLPYQGETFTAILYKQVHEPLPIDRKRCPAVPEDVWELLEDMTAKEREDRIPRAQEIMIALAPCVPGAPAGPAASRFDSGAFPVARIGEPHGDEGERGKSESSARRRPDSGRLRGPAARPRTPARSSSGESGRRVRPVIIFPGGAKRPSPGERKTADMPAARGPDDVLGPDESTAGDAIDKSPRASKPIAPREAETDAPEEQPQPADAGRIATGQAVLSPPPRSPVPDGEVVSGAVPGVPTPPPFPAPPSDVPLEAELVMGDQGTEEAVEEGATDEFVTPKVKQAPAPDQDPSKSFWGGIMSALWKGPQPGAPAGRASRPRLEIDSRKTPTERVLPSIPSEPLALPQGLVAGERPGEIVNERDGAVLILVEPGAFPMGSREEENEKPPHTVVLDAFLIDRFQVTNARYQRFLDWLDSDGDHGLCHPDEPENKDHTPGQWGRDAYHRYSPGDEHPVVNVDWFDAYAYASWAGLRLPTEAEWERAARGLDRRRFPWGAASPEDGAYAQYEGSKQRFRYTAPIGSHPRGASPVGCEDMAGNVREWCEDVYHPTFYARSPERNPVNREEGSQRVLRGGSWQNVATKLRAAARTGLAPLRRDPAVGFRCARSFRLPGMPGV